MEAVEKTMARFDEDSAIGPDSHTDLKAVRESIGSSIASTDSGHFEIRRMANDVEGTLDSTSIQKKISLRSRELQKHTLDIPDKQSR